MCCHKQTRSKHFPTINFRRNFHGHLQKVQGDEQGDKRNQYAVPHQIQLMDVNQFSQNTRKPPHKNNEVHQQMIPVFLKHAAKIGN